MSVGTLRLASLVPAIFVLLWSTGFIGAKYALPYIEPFNLLFLRMLANLAVFALLIWVLRASALSGVQIAHQSVVGLLVHAGYLGGVFAAIKLGMSAGVVALLVGLQPLLVALLVWISGGDVLRPVQWLGMALGISGVALVLYGNGKLTGFDVPVIAYVAAVVALVCIATGSLYQKRFGAGADLLSASFWQYLATAVVMALISWRFESGAVDWQMPLVLSLVWLVLGLSVVAVLLLLYMIREGESARVAAYFYLVPPTTALQAWWLFDERFTALALVGVVVTVLGVYLVLYRHRAAPA
jgi:drug/metabolite transporter (DMT)-like permease